MQRLILAGEAARRLAVTLTTLTDWERAGVLDPVMRLGPSNLRVYRASDVERLVEEREANKAAGLTPTGNGKVRKAVAAAAK